MIGMNFLKVQIIILKLYTSSINKQKHYHQQQQSRINFIFSFSLGILIKQMEMLLKQMRNVIVWMFMLIGVSVMCDTTGSCHLDSKLVQNNDLICQIDYQSCSNISTLVIQDCVGYSCRLSVGDRCYYYSYQSYSRDQCMSYCCGYNMTSYTEDYSYYLGQCLNFNQYQNPSHSSNPQPTSNKIAIILGAVMGGVFVIVVIACVCCRDRIKAFILPNPENNGQNPPQRHQHRLSFPQVDTITNINFIHESTSTQLHYQKQQQCTICLQQINNCRTHCSHWYHLQCLSQWIKKGFRCPNCTTQQINPITVFCMECKRPYAEIKIGKYTDGRQLEISLNSYKCNQCKNQN